MATSSGPDTREARPHLLEAMSLRARMVLIAAFSVATVVAAGGALLLMSVRTGLTETADQLGLAQAQQIAQLARQGTLPAKLVASHDLEVAAQVLKDGQVVSATSAAAARGFFGLPQQRPGTHRVVAVRRLPLDGDGPFRVTALGTRTPSGPATVFVAVTVEGSDDAVGAFVSDGLLGLVLLTLAVSGICWLVIGRTLSPVDAISRRAELITGHRLDQRVPEPRAHDEIRRLARTINDMLSRLERSAQRQERFVADAAHELRTPLATLRLRLETAVERGDPTEDKELVPDLLSETLRLGSLVEELLLLARSDAGRLAEEVGPVDLDDVVNDAVDASQGNKVAVAGRDIQPVQVLGEPGLLEQVVRNLVDNAVRHARTRVDVSLTTDDTSAVITVDDDGPGIPPEARRHVFERFVRLDAARERSVGGVGLGLAIVEEIVKLHAGSVQVTESPTAGARLRVRLPAG